jgi:hypothetical protein
MTDLKRKACKEELQKDDWPSKRFKLDKKFMAIVSSSEYDKDSGKVTVISPHEKVCFDMHLIGFKYLVFTY